MKNQDRMKTQVSDSRIKHRIRTCWRRLYPFGAWLALISGATAIALALFLATQVWEHRRQEFPRNLGNARAAALVAQRDTPPDLVKFAIIGDINNGTETFEKVASRLRAEQQVAFLVLLGDCAADPIRDLHMYFIGEFGETGLDLPTFIVAGNHDVEPGKFSYSEFEELYGPADFAFTYHDHLFIGLGGIHDDKRLVETLSFLEKTLQERRSLAKKVFVFMHYPPAASDHVPTVPRDEMKPFQSLFEQYKVTYVFSGHYHRLSRTDVNGVVYLVTGGEARDCATTTFRTLGFFTILPSSRRGRM